MFDKNLATASYQHAKGFTLELTGFKYTRADCGYLLNSEGTLTATVRGLIPRIKYQYEIYQTVTGDRKDNEQYVSVNGADEITTAPSASAAPTLTGDAWSDEKGVIFFEVFRPAGSEEWTASLSGLTISHTCQGICISLAPGMISLFYRTSRSCGRYRVSTDSNSV